MKTTSNIKLLSLTVIMLVIANVLFQSCSLKPLAWTPPESPKLEGEMVKNELLGATEWNDLRGWYGPEDIAIDKEGNMYCGARKSKTDFSDGGLYSYNPSTKKVNTLIEGSYFGNGVAVSQNDDFVLMVELTKYRVLRYWLKGEKAGETDIFLENLPGLPNGISSRDDGSFWLGFTSRRNDLLDNIQPKKGVKKFVYGIPLWLQPKQEPFGMIMHISESGKILKTYYDTTGKFVSEASSIEEHDGYIFIGGDLTDHIGKYKLK